MSAVEDDMVRLISQEKNTMSNNCKTPSDTSKASKSRPGSPQAGTSYEVFRNNTTAVEVIVKEVPNRRKGTKAALETGYHILNGDKIQKLEEEIENLKIDLNTANTKLTLSRKGFSNLVMQLQKELETVSRREIEAQNATIQLRMENEKLNALLETKSRLINKFSREIVSMQRLLKFVVKGLRFLPAVDNYSIYSDPEYEDFEKGLKHEDHVRFAPNVLDGTGGNVTLDSSL